MKEDCNKQQFISNTIVRNICIQMYIQKNVFWGRQSQIFFVFRPKERRFGEDSKGGVENYGQWSHTLRFTLFELCYKLSSTFLPNSAMKTRWLSCEA